MNYSTRETVRADARRRFYDGCKMVCVCIHGKSDYPLHKLKQREIIGMKQPFVTKLWELYR